MRIARETDLGVLIKRERESVDDELLGSEFDDGTFVCVVRRVIVVFVKV